MSKNVEKKPKISWLVAELSKITIEFLQLERIIEKGRLSLWEIHRYRLLSKLTI
jgi:hypothetical protein